MRLQLGGRGARRRETTAIGRDDRRRRRSVYHLYSGLRGAGRDDGQAGRHLPVGVRRGVRALRDAARFGVLDDPLEYLFLLPESARADLGEPLRGGVRRALYELRELVVSTTLALRAHALELRETGFRPSEDDGQRALGALVPVVAELEAAAAVEAPELGKYFSGAYSRVAAARVARAASLATTLPRIFDLSFKAISTIVLASFLLVDLGSPQFEAILFAVLACSFYLLESFVDDLEDPFGGSWTVDAASSATRRARHGRITDAAKSNKRKQFGRHEHGQQRPARQRRVAHERRADQRVARLA